MTVRTKMIVLIFTSVLLVTLTFLGGYMMGATTEINLAEGRIENLSNKIVECDKSISQWCSGKRIRAGTCDGNIQMCICASDEEVKNFEF